MKLKVYENLAALFDLKNETLNIYRLLRYAVVLDDTRLAEVLRMAVCRRKTGLSRPQASLARLLLLPDLLLLVLHHTILLLQLDKHSLLLR